MQKNKRSKKQLLELVNEMNEIGMKFIHLDPSLSALRRQGEEFPQEELEKLSESYDLIFAMLRPIMEKHTNNVAFSVVPNKSLVA